MPPGYAKTKANSSSRLTEYSAGALLPPQKYKKIIPLPEYETAGKRE